MVILLTEIRDRGVSAKKLSERAPETSNGYAQNAEESGSR